MKTGDRETERNKTDIGTMTTAFANANTQPSSNAKRNGRHSYIDTKSVVHYWKTVMA